MRISFGRIGQIIKATTFDDGEIQAGVEYIYKIRPVPRQWGATRI